MTHNSTKLDPLVRYFIGFDHLQRQLKEATAQNYPPFNIETVQDENGDNETLITLAVAGFARDELEVELHDQKLSVSGRKAEDEARNFVHKGISTRSFRQSFQLHEFLELSDVKLADGLMTITLKERIPEEKKPRKIAIN